MTTTGYLTVFSEAGVTSMGVWAPLLAFPWSPATRLELNWDLWPSLLLELLFRPGVWIRLLRALLSWFWVLLVFEMLVPPAAPSFCLAPVHESLRPAGVLFLKDLQLLRWLNEPPLLLDALTLSDDLLVYCLGRSNIWEGAYNLSFSSNGWLFLIVLLGKLMVGSGNVISLYWYILSQSPSNLR